MLRCTYNRGSAERFRHLPCISGHLPFCSDPQPRHHNYRRVGSGGGDTTDAPNLPPPLPRRVATNAAPSERLAGRRLHGNGGGESPAAVAPDDDSTDAPLEGVQVLQNWAGIASAFPCRFPSSSWLSSNSCAAGPLCWCWCVVV